MTTFQEKLQAQREARERQDKINAAALAAQAKVDYSSGHGWYGNGKNSTPPAVVESPETKAVLDSVKLPNWDFIVEDVPTINSRERSEGDQALDHVLQTLPITQAYRRWINKGEPVISYAGQVESIMIRCPMPGHEDTNPSAWCNTQKNVWVCSVCEYGGDAYDLAAIRFGYPVPGYKGNAAQFRQLRGDMARDFGIEIVKGVNGKEYVVPAAAGVTAPTVAPTPAPAVQVPSMPPRPEIPGIKKISAAPPKVAAGISLDDVVAMMRELPESTAPGVPGVAPAGAPAVPVVAPPVPPTASSVQIPHQMHAPVIPAIPQMPQMSGLPQIPAVGLGIPIIGSPVPTAPGAFVPTPLPATIGGVQINEPDPEMLESLGLSSSGETVTNNDFTGVSLDWASVTASGTFLDRYMQLAIRDDCPEEFHFFSALAALGLAVGRDLTLVDRNPVKANLNMCFMGPSGDGKSNAKRYLNKLMSAALPYDENDMGSKGVKIIANPASGEVMVREFMKKLMDPTNPRETLGYAPVRGVVDFPEFATLMKRAGSQGNTSAQFLMQFFDNDDLIRTSSLTSGVTLAKNAFATVISTTQPKALKDLVSEEHVSNGFLNRWLFVTGKTKMGLLDPIGEDEIDISPLVSPLQDIWGWSGQMGASSPARIPWSREALGLANQFIREVVYPARTADQSGLVTRSDLMFKKFVLLFTINVMQPVVPLQSVEWAMRMYDYIMATYSTLDSAVHHNVSSELRTQVIKAVVGLHAKSNRPPSLTQISEKVGRRQWNDKQVLECVQSLVKLGHVEEIPPGQGPGRKVVRYQYVASGE